VTNMLDFLAGVTEEPEETEGGEGE
jgi:hypothetical protein